MYSLSNSPRSRNYSLIHGMQNVSRVNRHENINLRPHLLQSSWIARCLSVSRSILKETPLLRKGSQQWAWLLSNPGWKWVCHYWGFVVPITEQSRFSTIPKGPRISNTVSNVESAGAIILNNIVSLPFNYLKPGIDFSFLAMKILDGIYFPYKGISSTLKKSLITLFNLRNYFLVVLMWLTGA